MVAAAERTYHTQHKRNAWEVEIDSIPSISWNAVLDGPGKNSSPTGKCQATVQVTLDF